MLLFTIAKYLEGSIEWSLAKVFVPYFVYDALSMVEAVVSGVAKQTRYSQGAGVATTENIKKNQKKLGTAVLLKLVLAALRLVQAAFVAAKIDGCLNWSWWLVLTPVWLYIAYFISRPVRDQQHAFSLSRLYGVDRDWFSPRLVGPRRSRGTSRSAPSSRPSASCRTSQSTQHKTRCPIRSNRRRPSTRWSTPSARSGSLGSSRRPSSSSRGCCRATRSRPSTCCCRGSSLDVFSVRFICSGRLGED